MVAAKSSVGEATAAVGASTVEASAVETTPVVEEVEARW